MVKEPIPLTDDMKVKQKCKNGFACILFVWYEYQSLACDVDEENRADRSSQHFFTQIYERLKRKLIDKCNNGTVARDNGNIPGGGLKRI
jgi:hypothetical protein